MWHGVSSSSRFSLSSWVRKLSRAGGDRGGYVHLILEATPGKVSKDQETNTKPSLDPHTWADGHCEVGESFLLEVMLEFTIDVFGPE